MGRTTTHRRHIGKAGLVQRVRQKLLGETTTVRHIEVTLCQRRTVTIGREWGTGIDILIDMIQLACYLYLVCHEKPELMLRVRFTTSSCVESSAEKSFGTMPIATPL